MKSKVAIVGRSNVGKSTLFNRIAGRRIAIVDEQPGVTRDRISAEVSWQKTRFDLIDTGGIVFDTKDPIKTLIKSQVDIAIVESQIILFEVDVTEGITPYDNDIATMLRKAGKPVFLVVNKVDNSRLMPHVPEFSSLGFREVFPVSSLHGRGIGDLLEHLTRAIPKADISAREKSLKIAIVGRPNVGKSSYVNRLLKEERVIVTETPGTTRDSIDIEFSRGKKHYHLIDTAGMRRKTQIRHAVEHYGFQRACQSIERCDVAILIIDALEGITIQDERITKFITECGKGMVIAVNKWDMVTDMTQKKYQGIVMKNLPYLKHASLSFMSALSGYGVRKTLKAVEEIDAELSKEIQTHEFNKCLKKAVDMKSPPIKQGRRLKIYYGTQISTKPVIFLLFVNNKRLLKKEYESYLLNRVREAFGFQGIPVKLITRNR